MSVLNQKTINKDLTFKGIGLHSGIAVTMTVKPAAPNSGIIFKRIDLKENNIIIPNIFNVSSAIFCTTISNEVGVSVSTVEHLMGALYGLGIDNVLIEIDNQEVPILDGSAKLFIEAISETGIKNSNAPIKIIKIEKKIEFNDEQKKISIEPSKISLDIDFELKYENSFIGNQAISLTEISPGKDGKVEFNGSLWEACSTAFIEPRVAVTIVGMKSIKLIVEPLKS